MERGDIFARSVIRSRTERDTARLRRFSGEIQPADQTSGDLADYERGAFARTAGFAVALVGSGLKTTGVVRCDQPRVLDFTARGARRLEQAPAGIVAEVMARLTPIFA